MADLSHDKSGAEDVPSRDWTIERIKKEIHKRMEEYKGSQKYYWTRTGFGMIADKLTECGAPDGLVDSVIERYRSNPKQ